MKIFYFAVVACLLTVVPTVHTQAQTPETSAFRGQKPTEPFLGVGIQVPLLKLFGKKKVKPLPEQPAVQSTEESDSVLNVSNLAELTSVDTLKANLAVSGPDLRKPEFNRRDLIPALGGQNLGYVGSVGGEEVIGQDFYNTYNNPVEYNIRPIRRGSGFESRLIPINARSKFEALSPTRYNKNTGIADGFMANIEMDAPPDGYDCTDWFIVTTDHATGEFVSEEYVGRTCTPSGGGVPDKAQRCRECKQYADRDHRNAMVLANTTLWIALGGSVIAGANVYGSAVVTTAILNAFPGIGTVASQALSVTAGLGVSVFTALTSIGVYNAALSSIENSHYKDLRDCDEKFCN